VTAGYGNAGPLDAMSAPRDLDQIEGTAAIRGPRAWQARFPMALRLTHVQDGRSPHAGSHGHRWGWLIRMIGWDRFAALAALPAEQRLAYLDQLRQHALSSMPQAQMQAPGQQLAGLLYAGGI
jgi:hypothetical protein